MSKIGKAATATVLSILCGLFGCCKAPEYTVADVRSVSVSCGHMDYSHSYAFFLRKTENGWLLDADFATGTTQPHTAYEAQPVTVDDAQTILGVIQELDGIGKLRRYKKPRMRVQVSDETVYYSMLGFADGKSLGAAVRFGDDLEAAFYRLAEKYAA